MKILFVKFGAIGDIVQSAVAIKHYKECSSSSRVTWLVSSQLVNFTKSLEVADDYLSFPFHELLGKRNLIFKILLILKFNVYNFKKLISFDEIYIPYYDFRYKFIIFSCFLCGKTILKFSKNRKLLRNRVFEILQLLGVSDHKVNINSLTSKLGERILRKTVNFVGSYENILSESEYIVIAPGGAKNLLRDDFLRRWPLDNYISIIKYFAAKNLKVVIMGGVVDQWILDHIPLDMCLNLIGKTSLIDTLHIMDKSKLVITHDSGPIHLASLTRAPLIGIFGPTSPNSVVSLGRPNSIFLSLGNKVPCSPCYDGHNYADCDTPLCMNLITVQSVLDSIDSLLFKI
jgi:heptosyltransferase-2